jgi:hypothetical protein
MVKKVCGKQKFFVTAGNNSFDSDDESDIVSDCNRVFVVGGIGGLTASDFNGTPITTLQGQRDAFVSGLDNCGNQKFFKTAGGIGSDFAKSISISEKDAFVTGLIIGPIANNFAGKPIPNLVAGQNAFVAGLNKKCGEQKFFVTSSGTAANNVRGNFIDNNEKRVFVSGKINGTEGTKFNGDPITLIGPENVFLAGLDHSGNEKFYKTASADFIDTRGLNLNCDRIFTSGNFAGTGVTEFNTTQINLTTSSHAYVAGLDHCGNQKFFKTSSIVDGAFIQLRSQEIFDECIYVTGILEGTAASNFDNNNVTLSGPNNTDIFVAGLDKCGKQKFYVTTSGSTASEFSFNITVNSSRVFVTGSIDGTANPRDFNGKLVKKYGSGDIFVAGLNHKGIQKFYKTAGGITFDNGLFVVSNEDAVYVSGTFDDGAGTGADFRGCIIELDPTKVTTFVAKLDNCGNQEFFLTAYNIQSRSLFIKDEKVFLEGRLRENAEDFNGKEIVSNGLEDIFVTRIDDLCPKPEIFRSKIPFF